MPASSTPIPGASLVSGQPRFIAHPLAKSPSPILDRPSACSPLLLVYNELLKQATMRLAVFDNAQH
jgi:hypothetical protein